MLAADKPAPAECSASGSCSHGAGNQLQRRSMDQADKATLAADQIKLRDFEASLTPETSKLASNQHKLSSLREAVKADQEKMAADHIKFAAPPAQ
jgi:hypothetical protein